MAYDDEILMVAMGSGAQTKEGQELLQKLLAEQAQQQSSSSRERESDVGPAAQAAGLSAQDLARAELEMSMGGALSKDLAEKFDTVGRQYETETRQFEEAIKAGEIAPGSTYVGGGQYYGPEAQKQFQERGRQLLEVGLTRTTARKQEEEQRRALDELAIYRRGTDAQGRPLYDVEAAYKAGAVGALARAGFGDYVRTASKAGEIAILTGTDRAPSVYDQFAFNPELASMNLKLRKEADKVSKFYLDPLAETYRKAGQLRMLERLGSEQYIKQEAYLRPSPLERRVFGASVQQVGLFPTIEKTLRSAAGQAFPALKSIGLGQRPTGEQWAQTGLTSAIVLSPFAPKAFQAARQTARDSIRALKPEPVYNPLTRAVVYRPAGLNVRAAATVEPGTYELARMQFPTMVYRPGLVDTIRTSRFSPPAGPVSLGARVWKNPITEQYHLIPIRRVIRGESIAPGRPGPSILSGEAPRVTGFISKGEITVPSGSITTFSPQPLSPSSRLLVQVRTSTPVLQRMEVRSPLTTRSMGSTGSWRDYGLRRAQEPALTPEQRMAAGRMTPWQAARLYGSEAGIVGSMAIPGILGGTQLIPSTHTILGGSKTVPVKTLSAAPTTRSWASPLNNPLARLVPKQVTEAGVVVGPAAAVTPGVLPSPSPRAFPTPTPTPPPVGGVPDVFPPVMPPPTFFPPPPPPPEERTTGGGSRIIPPRFRLPGVWSLMGGYPGFGRLAPRRPVGFWQTTGYKVAGVHPLTGRLAGGVVGRRRIKYGATPEKVVRGRV